MATLVSYNSSQCLHRLSWLPWLPSFLWLTCHLGQPGFHGYYIYRGYQDYHRYVSYHAHIGCPGYHGNIYLDYHGYLLYRYILSVLSMQCLPSSI
jgi:hypothetical protein